LIHEPSLVQHTVEHAPGVAGEATDALRRPLRMIAALSARVGSGVNAIGSARPSM
jgi:hypothetical protein